MDFSIAKQLFESLYHDVNGYLLSSRSREKMTVLSDKSYTYGEIVPESFQKFVEIAKPEKDEIFYDLGSGTGKAVILAALMFDFSVCRGIELLEDLYKVSQDIKIRFDHEIRNQFTGPPIEMVNSDFLTYDFSDADIVFMHSTCFSDELMIKITKKLESLKIGSRVISVTKTIDSPKFIRMHSDDYLFGWGKATVYCYKRIE